MARVELAQAALDALQASTVKTSIAQNHEEARRLRGKIVGVLLRIHRLEAECSLADCATFLRAEPQTLEAWEYGDEAPCLAELELLGVFLNGSATAADGYSPLRGTGANAEYLRIRRRLTGGMLRAAREAAGLSQRELGVEAGLDADGLERFELGEESIPLSSLAALAQALELDLGCFLVKPKFLLEESRTASVAEGVSEDEAEWRQFSMKRENQAVIRLAMAFQQMARADLHRIAEALVAIIKAKGELAGLSGSPS